MHILVRHDTGDVGLNQQRLRIRSWERSPNSSSESPARRVRSVNRHRDEQILASETGSCSLLEHSGSVARGSSRECAETACGLRERRRRGASRAVPGGARPSGHCCNGGLPFFMGRPSASMGNTFYASRERIVSPFSRPSSVTTECRHRQKMSVGSFESRADLLRPAVVIKSGAIASLALRRARPESEVSVGGRFDQGTGLSISGATDLSTNRIDLPGRFIKLIGRRLRRKQESVRAETRTSTASSVPHRCRVQYAAVYALSTQPTLFGEMSLIRIWSRIGTNGKIMVQSFDGTAEAADAFERLERIKRRRGYAAMDEKLP